MVAACDIEVDVNGEETFMVSKDILSSFSGRISKLFHEPAVPESKKTSKVILHNMPGGAQGFELMARFCYSSGRLLHVTPANACLVHCAAEFMEVAEEASSPNLIKLTEKCLEEMPYWSWPEIMNALRQCQCFLAAAISSGIFDKILDSVAGRILTASDASPTVTSPESSAFRFSCDTRSTISTRSSIHRAWWFDDLVLLNPGIVQRVVKLLIDRKADHAMISRFLFYYLRCGVSCPPSMKRKVIENVIDLLYSLDRNCVSCKGLFGVLRVSSSVRLIKACQTRLEEMIGSQIDQATVDSLLVPAPSGKGSHYDVNLVLRFLISFLATGVEPSASQMKRVGCLIDAYLAEVAPESSLQPSKFMSLITVLPDAARDSYDAVYRATDLYLQVHTQLSEEEKMRICRAINYDKLSSESCKHLAMNSKFPSKAAVRALISQQSKLKNHLRRNVSYRIFAHPPPPKQGKPKESQFDANRLDLSMENEKLKAQLLGIQWRVMELEKLCKEMQLRMTKVMKNKISSSSVSRSLPWLCS